MRVLHPAVLALAALSAFAQKPCGNTPVYTACDIAFDLPAGSPAPAALELAAEFRGPDYKTYRLPAFLTGPNRVAVRINPVNAGKWTYRLSGNVPSLDGKVDEFQAVANPDATPFIKRSNVHHWEYTEGLKPHFYLAAPFTSIADLPAWAKLKFTHVALSIPLTLDPAVLTETDQRVAAINDQHLIADLIVTPSPAALLKAFPERTERDRFFRMLIARYSSFNITWQLAGEWESSTNARATLKELGLAIKQADPYSHPRSSRSLRSSSPLGPDGWMDHSIYGEFSEPVVSVEHQLYNVPQVVLLDAALPADTFRKQLWNASVSGAYLALKGSATPASPNAIALGHWAEYMTKRTRFWDIEPFFGLDGGRAIANPGRKDEDGEDEFQAVEFLVYIETPGQVELRVQKRTYDIWWLNPLTGEATKEKKDWKGEIYTATPPDSSHDWVLHLSRDGKKEGMLKSYKFESWPVPIQEPERDAKKAPFDLIEPAADATLTTGEPIQYTIKLKRQTGGTRRMSYLISGEVVRDGQGNRILSTGPNGEFTIPADVLTGAPSVINLRVAALNAPGKLYLIDYIFNVKSKP